MRLVECEVDVLAVCLPEQPLGFGQDYTFFAEKLSLGIGSSFPKMLWGYKPPERRFKVIQPLYEITSTLGMFFDPPVNYVIFHLKNNKNH